MSRGTAIKAYCRECAGGSHLEVVVCHLADCPLWQYRTGYSASATAASARKALSRHPDIAKELADMGLDACFLKNPIKKSRTGQKKSSRTANTTGVERRPARIRGLKAQGDALTGPTEAPEA